MSNSLRRKYHIWVGGVVFALVVSVVLGIMACTRAPQPPPKGSVGEATTPTPAPEKRATFRLNWKPDPTFTGAYIAKSRHTWADRYKVDVTIKEGGASVDPVRLVADGTDTFGVIGANKLLYAREQGYPLVAVCCEMQTNPVGWVVKEDSAIKGFKDFAGRRIGHKVGDESDTIMEAVFGKVGLSDADVKLVAVGFAPDPFITGTVDALPVYINEEPYTIAAKGVEVRVLHPSQIGISLYGNVLVARKETIDRDPELVQGLVSGILDAWNEARKGSPATIAEELVRVEPQMGEVPTEKVLSKTLELVFGDLEATDRKLGWMDLEGWQRSHDVLEKYADLKLTEDMTEVYTNSFVEAYYKQG